MYKVVLDTNILLVSISRKSKYHWIFKLFLDYRITLVYTTEILMEYAEILEVHMGKDVSDNVLRLLEIAHNTERINTYFKFDLLEDKDDNKFVDCAIAGNADFILTEDKDFNMIKQIEFPKVYLKYTRI